MKPQISGPVAAKKARALDRDGGNPGGCVLKIHFLFSTRGGRLLFMLVLLAMMATFMFYIPKRVLQGSHPKSTITISWGHSSLCASTNCNRLGSGGEPILSDDATLDRHDSPLSAQEEVQIAEQRAADRTEIKLEKGRFLNKEDKKRIAFHLQEAIGELQDDYAKYMARHRYMRQRGHSADNKTLFHPNPSTVPHTLACPSHQAGLVPLTHSTTRGYCHGSAKLPGPRVCDTLTNNYAKGNNSKKPVTFELYQKTFAFSAFYHVSRFTQNARRNQSQGKHAITVATQGSWNRVDHIIQLAKLWKGPISVALLLDHQDQASLLDRTLATLPSLAEYVDLHLVWRDDHTSWDPDAFYPINMLRNMALQGVETEHVFVIDVDNIPNAPHEKYVQWVMEAEKSVAKASEASDCPGLDAFVPPAVEMLPASLKRMYSASHSTDTLPKDALIKAFYAGTALPMHLYFGPAYVPTNHFTWASSNTVDRLQYLTRFEPYYVARMPVPLFNETFVNRGGNYAQQVLEMHAAGYSFWRLPEAFVVDVPHSTAEKESTQDDDDSSSTVEENSTSQAVHDHSFTTRTWDAFHSYLSHRYHFHVASPCVTDIPFRKYRRSQEKIVNAMWHMLASTEANDLAR